jgi:hypothetical protein
MDLRHRRASSSKETQFDAAPYEQNGPPVELGAGGENCRSASPDFLLNLVALANFMRLSLLKGAHVALSCAAWREIRVCS